MSIERRLARIRPWGAVSKTAMIIIIDDNSPTIRCTLLDISAGGACLQVANPDRPPERLDLLHGKLKKRCLLCGEGSRESAYSSDQ